MGGKSVRRKDRQLFSERLLFFRDFGERSAYRTILYQQGHQTIELNFPLNLGLVDFAHEYRRYYEERVL